MPQVDTVLFPAALAALSDINWDVELQFARGEYLIDGSIVTPESIFGNTADFSGSTDPWPDVTIDFNGCPSTWPEALGALKSKFARVGGFLLQAETNFTSFAAFSVQAAASSNWSNGVDLLEASPTGLVLTQPSAATVADHYATGYRSRLAWLCTPTVSAASLNGSVPISLAGEAINFSFVGMTIKSNLQFLRMAPATGITAEQLMLLSA
jgi:hypothetical protein